MFFGYKHKVSNKSYSINDLPSNRKELFFDLVKNRLWILIKLGLICLIFSSTLILSQVIKELEIININNLVKQELINDQDGYKLFLTISLRYDILNILFLIILSIGLSGVVRIIKLMIWGEGIIFTSDFLNGVKQNYKQYMLLFIIIGFVTLINNFILSLSNPSIDTNVSFMFPSIFSLIVLFPLGAFYFSQVAYYKNKFFINIINATKMYINSPLKTIGVLLLCSFTYFLVLLVPFIFVKFILISIWVVLLLPIIILIWMLYSISLFDRFINVNLYPDIVNKGLWIKDVNNINKE